MKVAVVSTFDVQGGAARAAAQLHRALLTEGGDAEMLVAHRGGSGRGVRALEPRPLCRALRFADEWRARRSLGAYRHTRPAGYESFQPDRPLLGRLLEGRMPRVDLLNLHWVAGLLDFGTLPRLAARAPIAWTLHDMLPLTGGCHYDGGCGRFAGDCGACPQLGSSAPGDLSADIQRRRRTAFEGIPQDRLHFIAPSRWMAAQVARSAHGRRFPHSVIPYGIDLQAFRPVDRAQARAELGLPADRAILLFASDDLHNRRKGMATLVEALAGVEREAAFLVSIGRAGPTGPEVPNYRNIPYVDDDRRLALFYAAADALALPSLQDNMPLTMLEAMACGTPVVAFDEGGMRDVIRDGESGFLVPERSAAALRAALQRIVRDRARAQAMGASARQQMLDEHAPQLQARRYLELFRTMREGGIRRSPASAGGVA